MPKVCRRAARRAANFAFAVAAIAGCSDSTGVSLGTATVTVVDANNAPVSSFPVTLLRASDRTPWRALYTGTNGTGEFGDRDGGVLPGNYLVHADVHLVSHTLVAGEANDKPLTVVANQSAGVTFRVLRAVEGGTGQ